MDKGNPVKVLLIHITKINIPVNLPLLHSSLCKWDVQKVIYKYKYK